MELGQSKKKIAFKCHLQHSQIHQLVEMQLVKAAIHFYGYFE